VNGEDIILRVASSVSEVDRADWDGCAGTANPFVSHSFLAALEASGSVGPGTGWQPRPLILDDADGRPTAIAPAYLKSHSQGEYVFDQGWAQAWQNAGGAYYPKLQIAAPFSPVPGPRLLLRERAAAPALIAGLEALVAQNGLSSAHATFVAPEQMADFRDAGWLIREDSQYHWRNRGYRDYADFLDSLTSRHRKALRKERERAVAGLEIIHLTGGDISEAHWDAFWDFYQDTGARKWGRPYLTRAFFSLLGAAMADRLLLILALEDRRPIAGALNLIGADTLYGRYWGCTREVPFLHFELCYHQAIDAAIARGLGTVEAGAQGEHKLGRGYEPVATFSAHFIPHEGFREAVADFLRRERAAVQADRAWLAERAPFKAQD
jgi:uncharacterized protein